MPRLNWIDDNTLADAIRKFKESAQSSINFVDKRQQKNIIDPFMSLMIASVFELDNKEQLVKTQNLKSALSGMSNALGKFHQDVLAGVDGWANHDAGYDLECEESKIVAEIKNKHNTMNASNRDKVIGDLDTAVRQKGQGWSGYLVIVIPKRPCRYCLRLQVTREVYEIDGASFYHKITNSANALHDLFDVLCDEFASPEEIKKYSTEVFGNSFPPRQ